MKRVSFSTFLQLLFVACAFNLSSCQEFNIDTQESFPPKMETDVQPEYTVLAKSPRTITFNVSSSTPWAIKSSAEWCRPTPAMSSASSLIAEISVLIDENETEQDRVATLTLTAEGIDGATTVTIHQDSKSSLGVQPVDDPLPTEGGTTTFTVLSNKAWTATSSNQWLALSQSSGTGTGELEVITATATTNPGMRRTATVTVSNGLEEKVFEVIQNGIVLTFVDATEVIFDGSADKEVKRIEVLSNIDWEVSTDATWLNVAKDEEGRVVATSLSEIYFTTRTAHLALNATDKMLGLEPVVLEVKQVGGVYMMDGTPGVADEATGAITFNEPTGNANCRYYIDKPRHLAIHEWNFSHIEVDDNRCLNMNCVASPIPSWNFWLGKGANPWTFKYRGGTLNDNTLCEPFDMNSLRSLKVEHNYVDPTDRTQANIKVFIKLEGDAEWKKIIETKAYENLFETTGSGGNVPYFGLINGSAGKAGSVTISSYEVTNIE